MQKQIPAMHVSRTVWVGIVGVLTLVVTGYSAPRQPAPPHETGSPAEAQPAPITFDEIAKQAGVNFVLNNSASPNKNQPESVVGGVALLDYDGDGYLDIYFVN